ncbi:tRNA (cytosine) methyltransferase [Aureococcus anophagefferens]|nr:tRNA (cytosine) methyltransferase [Aureococcus anophagefferens]
MDELSTLVEWYATIPKTQETPTNIANILATPTAAWAEDAGLDAARRADGALRVAAQGACLAPFWVAKYERESAGAWHAFYKRNADKAYKDRHYLDDEWSDACSPRTRASSSRSAAASATPCSPVLASHPRWRGVAVDFAASAIDLLRKRPDFDAARVVAATRDVVRDELPVADGAADVVTCLFVLSALAPETMAAVAGKLARKLRPGGSLLFRDYGRYDEAQLRFKKGHRLGDNFYVKQDATRCFYFDLTTPRPSSPRTLSGGTSASPASSTRTAAAEAAAARFVQGHL